MKDEKLKKNNQDIYIYSDLVIPTLKELKNKELLINKLFDQMEFYENTDKALFNICYFCYLNCHQSCRDANSSHDKLYHEKIDYKGIKEFYCICVRYEKFKKRWLLL